MRKPMNKEKIKKYCTMHPTTFFDCPYCDYSFCVKTEDIFEHSTHESECPKCHRNSPIDAYNFYIFENISSIKIKKS